MSKNSLEREGYGSYHNICTCVAYFFFHELASTRQPAPQERGADSREDSTTQAKKSLQRFIPFSSL
jgi:hypothetical protein